VKDSNPGGTRPPGLERTDLTYSFVMAHTTPDLGVV